MQWLQIHEMNVKVQRRNIKKMCMNKWIQATVTHFCKRVRSLASSLFLCISLSVQIIPLLSKNFNENGRELDTSIIFPVNLTWKYARSRVGSEEPIVCSLIIYIVRRLFLHTSSSYHNNAVKYMLANLCFPAFIQKVNQIKQPTSYGDQNTSLKDTTGRHDNLYFQHPK